MRLILSIVLGLLVLVPSVVTANTYSWDYGLDGYVDDRCDSDRPFTLTVYGSTELEGWHPSRLCGYESNFCTWPRTLPGTPLCAWWEDHSWNDSVDSFRFKSFDWDHAIVWLCWYQDTHWGSDYIRHGPYWAGITYTEPFSLTGRSSSVRKVTTSNGC